MPRFYPILGGCLLLGTWVLGCGQPPRETPQTDPSTGRGGEVRLRKDKQGAQVQPPPMPKPPP
jgi:hypothetical protein